MKSRFHRIALAAALLTSLAAAQAHTAIGASSDDLALANSVKAALVQATPFQDADADITVTATGGKVALTGWVTYVDDDMLARQIAASVGGVNGVTSNFHAWSTDNDARIGRPFIQAPAMDAPAVTSSASETGLAAEVKAALLKAEPFQDKNVELAVNATPDGKVQLSGWVGYANDDLAARAIALQVPGVKSVTSNFRAWSSELDGRV